MNFINNNKLTIIGVVITATPKFTTVEVGAAYNTNYNDCLFDYKFYKFAGMSNLDVPTKRTTVKPNVSKHKYSIVTFNEKI
jgi:hypothetical protein